MPWSLTLELEGKTGKPHHARLAWLATVCGRTGSIETTGTRAKKLLLRRCLKTLESGGRSSNTSDQDCQSTLGP